MSSQQYDHAPTEQEIRRDLTEMLHPEGLPRRTFERLVKYVLMCEKASAEGAES